MTNSMWVPPLFCHAISSHLILWPIGSEWHSTPFSARQSHHISSHDQQGVSGTPTFFLPGNVITFHLMTNSKWVTPPFLFQVISSHFIPWPTACEWYSLLCSARQSHHNHLMTNSLWETLPSFFCQEISSHFIPWWQEVSDTPTFFLPCNLITFHLMTNSKWVTLHPFFCQALSSHFIPWPTACEWHSPYFSAMQPHHVSSHDQQGVSDTLPFSLPGNLIRFHPWPTASEWHSPLFLPGNFITFHCMTNSLWVTLPLFFQAMSSDFIPWPTGSEWHYPVFSARQSHHISSHDQQLVSDTPLFSARQFHPISFHDQQLVSELPPPFSARQSHHISSHDQQGVCDTPLFLLGNLITFHPMTNSEWVTLPLLFCQAISSYFIPWSTGSEWHFPLFPARQSHHIPSHGKQQVSEIPPFFVPGNLITFHLMTNSLWVTLPHSFCQAISLHSIPWPTGSEWHSPLFLLIIHLPMTNSLWVIPSFSFCQPASSHHIPC